MKVAVYTCVTRGYDPIRAPSRPDPRVDYHCFTDRTDLAESPWRAHCIDLPHLDGKAQNRYVKMLAHRLAPLAGYDIVVYVDGSILLEGNLYEFAESCWHSGAELMLYEHPLRDCVFTEAEVCARVGHAPVFALARQMRRYRHAGFREGAGLFEAGVIVRRPTRTVERVMEGWWAEFTAAGTGRDQLSLTYAAWRAGVTVRSLGRSDPRFGHRYFKLVPHNFSVGDRLRAALIKWSNLAAMRLLPSRWVAMR